jgi:hypothetical protein
MKKPRKVAARLSGLIAANDFAAILRASALLVSTQVMSLSSILPK